MAHHGRAMTSQHFDGATTVQDGLTIEIDGLNGLNSYKMMISYFISN